MAPTINVPDGTITPEIVMKALVEAHDRGLEPSHWLVGMSVQRNWYAQGITICGGSPSPKKLVQDPTFGMGDYRAFPTASLRPEQLILVATNGTQIEAVKG